MLYIGTVLVAALPYYDAGRKQVPPEKEVWGELTVDKDEKTGTMVASLKQPHVSRYDSAALPPLYEPGIRLLVGGRLDLRGVQQQDGGWHMQIWSCRLVSGLEEVMSHQAPVLTLSGLPALYQRQWTVLEAAAVNDGQQVMDVARVSELLDVTHEKLYPFLEWANRTNRGNTIHGGTDGLGRICFKAPVWLAASD